MNKHIPKEEFLAAFNDPTLDRIKDVALKLNIAESSVQRIAQLHRLNGEQLFKRRRGRRKKVENK